jgi:hypothetical protein
MGSPGDLFSCRWLRPPAGPSWTQPAVSEWELRCARYTDRHPHEELNYVLEGVLHVTAGGVTRTARAGEIVVVEPGVTGTYWTDSYARMLAIYGPNPSGAASEYPPGATPLQEAEQAADTTPPD